MQVALLAFAAACERERMVSTKGEPEPGLSVTWDLQQRRNCTSMIRKQIPLRCPGSITGLSLAFAQQRSSSCRARVAVRIRVL